MKALVKQNGNIAIKNTLKPQQINSDDVLIKVVLTGLCRTDIYVAQDIIKTKKDSLILGHEFSGIVETTGADVIHVKQGDRVCVMPFLHPNNTLNEYYDGCGMLGLDGDGSMAEYIKVPAYAVFKLPENVSFKLGAYMEPICASMAVLNADIKPNQKGLIYGDNRISQLTLRILKAKGFKTVDIYGAGGNDLPADNSYDFIIETRATTQTFNDMINIIKPGGVLVLKSRQHTPVEMNINRLVQKEIRLQAVNYANFQDCIDLAASGLLNVDDLLGDVYPLEAYDDVFNKSQATETKKLFLTTVNEDVWNS